MLSADDIIWIAAQAAAAGYTKFKLTGGEPSRHPQIMEIISGIASLGVDDLSMITNGHRLLQNARRYRSNGLHRLNVSLYSFNPVKFRNDNGGTQLVLSRVIAGIDEAISCGYTSLKLNYIWDRSDNLSDFLEICSFVAERNLTIVLLPKMNYGSAAGEELISLSFLYDMLCTLGIADEKTLTDAEGIEKNLVTLNNGARVLIRKQELREKLPYNRCKSCVYKGDCREGIFPTRLSASGELFPCLADTTARISLMSELKNRDAAAVQDALTVIRTL
ncbi:MAG: hypothetical protein AMXMBFR48_14620 [Ignavibacteriales bacterium]